MLAHGNVLPPKGWRSLLSILDFRFPGWRVNQAASASAPAPPGFHSSITTRVPRHREAQPEAAVSVEHPVYRIDLFGRFGVNLQHERQLEMEGSRRAVRLAGYVLRAILQDDAIRLDGRCRRSSRRRLMNCDRDLEQQTDRQSDDCQHRDWRQSGLDPPARRAVTRSGRMIGSMMAFAARPEMVSFVRSSAASVSIARQTSGSFTISRAQRHHMRSTL